MSAADNWIAAGHNAPIAYFKMEDPTKWHINSGTGGNMVPNGVVGRSQRGPNQWNCAASEFLAASNQYINCTTLGADPSGNTKTCTLAASFMINPTTGSTVFSMGVYQGESLLVYVINGGILMIAGHNQSGSRILDWRIPITYGKHITVEGHIDMANQSMSEIRINNVPVTELPQTFIDDTFRYSTADDFAIGRHVANTTGLFNGDIGEVYFDRRTMGSPGMFWNDATSTPKPVSQVISEIGIQPFLGLPVRADSPEKNLGFAPGIINAMNAPYKGARGASEFWSRSASFDGSTSNYLSTTSLTGISESRTITIIAAINPDSLPGTGDHIIGIGEEYPGIKLEVSSSGNARVTGVTSSPTLVLDAIQNFTITTGDWFIILFSCDLDNSSNRHFYINGDNSSVSWNQYAPGNLALTGSTNTIGRQKDGSGVGDGDMGFIYLSTDYINFGDENNRLKVVDGLGYPTDITKAIETGDLPTPQIYMPFNDPDDLGNNLYGSNFTVNGTILQGADVNA